MQGVLDMTCTTLKEMKKILQKHNDQVNQEVSMAKRPYQN